MQDAKLQLPELERALLDLVARLHHALPNELALDAIRLVKATDGALDGLFKECRV